MRGGRGDKRVTIPCQHVERLATVKQLANAAYAAVWVLHRVEVGSAFPKLVARHEQAFSGLRVVELDLLGVGAIGAQQVSALSAVPLRCQPCLQRG